MYHKEHAQHDTVAVIDQISKHGYGYSRLHGGWNGYEDES